MVTWLAGWLLGRLATWSHLDAWFLGCMATRLLASLVGWLIGRSVGRSVVTASSSSTTWLRICSMFRLLALKGIYHYWKYVFSKGIKQMEAAEN